MTKNSFSVHSDLVRWVLVETSHAGNVGSTARALRTMGFENLHLIRPRQENMHEDAEAIALASGAGDLLAKTTICQSLSQALHSCNVVLGLTSREREFGPPALNWNGGLDLLLDAVSNQQCVAMVFGPERTGLENEDLAFCTHRVYLPANPDYPSLNLAQAVMVCAFGLRQVLMEGREHIPQSDPKDLADPIAVAAMLEHWQAGLEAIGYLDPNHPKKLMPRLQALFARAHLRKEEIDLLRGIAKQMILRK